MFKFIRKILVLGLVFSLSIPSFAAVSVSDGSAFVSKAEFSASLNNLSSRMSNLENSLDAKIDSLVSSYLSRNGIWNGEKQNVMGTGHLIKNGNSGVIKQHNRYFVEHYFQLLEKSSKSGLLNLKFSFPMFTKIFVSDCSQYFSSVLTLYFVYLITSEAPSNSISTEISSLFKNSNKVYSDSRVWGTYSPFLTNTTIDQGKWYDCLNSNNLPEQSFEVYFFINKGDALYFTYCSLVSHLSNEGSWVWNTTGSTGTTTSPTVNSSWSNSFTTLSMTVY